MRGGGLLLAASGGRLPAHADAARHGLCLTAQKNQKDASDVVKERIEASERSRSSSRTAKRAENTAARQRRLKSEYMRCSRSRRITRRSSHVIAYFDEHRPSPLAVVPLLLLNVRHDVHEHFRCRGAFRARERPPAAHPQSRRQRKRPRMLVSRPSSAPSPSEISSNPLLAPRA